MDITLQQTIKANNNNKAPCMYDHTENARLKERTGGEKEKSNREGGG